MVWGLSLNSTRVIHPARPGKPLWGGRGTVGDGLGLGSFNVAMLLYAMGFIGVWGWGW